MGKTAAGLHKIVKSYPVVYGLYRDHVVFHRLDPVVLKPQLREAVGWLLYECAEYIIICWDQEVKPPSLKEDRKASGCVILRSDIVEMRRLPLQNFSNWLLCRASALTSNRRVGASEREAKNSAFKKKRRNGK